MPDWACHDTSKVCRHSLAKVRPLSNGNENSLRAADITTHKKQTLQESSVGIFGICNSDLPGMPRNHGQSIQLFVKIQI